MAYTALARRYRSQSFDEVVGQEPIVRTLKSAIATGRVAHAYLFTGTRGVGKTSMARLFARELAGGSKEVDDLIMAGKDTDVIEIDGASNRKVEEARELIANSIYRPLRCKKKVYIIDEVHMLTREAFNTLLKTMEEPPDHIVFILCTTEPNKVPETIRSRCQRFDFRAIPTPVIADHLREVIKREGNHDAEPELIQAVARLGNGSMRDALSVLDRLLASGEKKVTVELLESLLGMPDRELVGSLIRSLADGDARTALERSDELLRRGTGIDQILETLMARFRDLMVLAACGPETDLVDASGATRKEDAELAARFDPAGLVHMIALCESVQRAVKSSTIPRALLDALIVRLANAEKFADVAALVAGSANAALAPRPAAPPRAAPPPANQAAATPVVARGSPPAKKR